jgi:hypothetical protein
LPRFADLRGKRIGLLDNSKPNADKLAGRLAELLQERYGAGEIVMRRKLTAQEGAPQHYLDELAAAADLVLSGLGDTSAEGEDGKMHGSVVGTITTDGSVHRLRTIDRRWKVEGVHASVDTGVLDLLFVCDQDDPKTPSPLLGATMPLDAAFEPRG